MNFRQKCLSFFHRHDTAIVRVLMMIFFSMLLTLSSEWIVRNSLAQTFSWAYNYSEPFFFTSILFFFLQFFLFSVFRRTDFPLLIIGLLDFALCIACYFKKSYRSEPLYPWDLSLAGTAAKIADEVELIPTASMIMAVLFLLFGFAGLLAVRLIFIRKKILRFHRKTARRRRQIALQIGASALVLVCYVLFVLNNTVIMEFFGITESAFRQNQASKRNGFVQSFVMNTKYIFPQKPEDYHEESVTRAASEIRGYRNQSTGSIRPNLIFLMSESYADISLCENVTFEDDIFACTDYLKKNYISGQLLGQQYGGGTCNTEFEVLTGYAMNYLPSGCTPYQQYFNKQQPTFVSFVRDMGYSTVAIHSYGKRFWNRDIAYPNMGFDVFLAEDSFENPLRRRGLIKDDELVNKIIEQYEANLPSGKPFFNFSVSMQNHGSFTDGQYLKNYRAKLSCSALTEEQEGILITYATGIRDANTALEHLIDYFSQVNEPTVICMFGDHLGSLGGSDEIYIKSGYMNDPESSAEDARKKYSTPFFIWDNYTSMHFTANHMSFYQLIPSICRWYDLDRPAFFDYLLEQQNYLRGVSFDIYLDEQGVACYDIEDAAKAQQQKHYLFQYDLLFGKRYGLEKLYSSATMPSYN